MKYRQIAKIVIHDMIKERVVVAEDGNVYGQKKPFTDNQAMKLRDALTAEQERLRAKLKKQGVKV